MTVYGPTKYYISITIVLGKLTWYYQGPGLGQAYHVAALNRLMVCLFLQRD